MNVPEWDKLASELNHPFLQTAWLQAWWDCFAPRGASLVAEAWRGDCCAPLLQQGQGRLVAALANVHTPISGTLLPARDDELGLRLPERTRRLLWPALNHHDAARLASGLETAGWLALVERQHTSPVVLMADSAERYAQSRGRNLRQRATRLERKLRRESSAALTIARPSEDRRLFERCLQLEARGWKGKAGTAVLSSVRTARFYRQVAEQPAARLFALDSSHGLLAFSLCLLHRQRLFLLKTAYNEEHRTASPGLVLHYATIGVCHELNLEAYELLGGADPWKLRLANGSRSISRLVAHRPTLLGSAGHRVRAARPLAKRWRTQLSRKGSGRWRFRSRALK